MKTISLVDLGEEDRSVVTLVFNSEKDLDNIISNLQKLKTWKNGLGYPAFYATFPDSMTGEECDKLLEKFKKMEG